MAIDEPDVVDSIGIDKVTACVVLSLIDADDWTDSAEHIEKLEKKLNAYIKFIESGEMLETYPKSKGRAVVIEIIFRCAPDLKALGFLSHAGISMQREQIKLQFRTHE
jgi:hypothetical protein